MLDDQLHIFKIVVECNSFSRAAKHLHLTQSSISQQIRKLEEYYGVKLFERLYRRIVITDAGKMLYPFTVELENLYNRVDGSFQRLTGDISGFIHIGASLTIGEYVLPGLLIEFKRCYPKVEITMEIFNSEQITAMVANAEIDLGFIEGPVGLPDVLSGQVCGGDELVIVAAPEYGGGPAPIPLKQLLREEWVMREKSSGTRRVLNEFIKERGWQSDEVNVVMELGSTQAVKEAVKSGIGITALSSLAVREELLNGSLKRLAIADGPINRKFSLIFQRERFWTYVADRFRSFLEERLVAGEHPDDRPAEAAEQYRAEE